ncbi:epoxide hydrolase family protein [Saccharothrix deserti]|uniref:epoxide hydrolase family protein n=1 Tax=Saccharothrix deserti TaxID=2593674 RepID=UPI00131B18A5|nr:epoxide hydrolase family protein [Saccharothrix deserti]
MTNNSEIRPFRIDVPQSGLDDLDARLDAARWPDQPAGVGWSQGTPVPVVRELARYWRESFDWRAVERRINELPQFTTDIDGQTVHFLHIRSDAPDAFPVLLTHGWPGTFVEWLPVIGHLTGAGVHLVIPSLPGFAFSGPTATGGWDLDRTARAWAELMRRLGYDRYVAAGNDGGSLVSPVVGRVDPDHVAGVYVTQAFSFPSGDPAEMADLTEDEQRRLGVLGRFWEEMSGYDKLQSTRPQQLAYALTDSPVGQLAWVLQLLWGEDMPEDTAAALDRDFVLTVATIFWVTGTAGSSARFYWENAHADQPEGPTTAPLGVVVFRDDFQSIRRFAQRDHANIVHWSEFDTGGHYPGLQTPDLFSADLVGFVGKVR